jgi:hypothetical protein
MYPEIKQYGGIKAMGNCPALSCRKGIKMTVTPILPPTKQTIVDLLDELPPESLATVETFIRFVHTQAHQGRPVVTTAELVSHFRYPTVPVPPPVWMSG